MFPSPLLTPPTLEDWEYSYNGLTFGGNTPFGVLQVEGLDLAEIRSGDVNWPRDHGQARGLDVFGGRDVIFDFFMVAGGTSLQARQLELAAASNVRPNEELPLWFQLPNLPLLCIMCRPRKRPLKIESDYAAAQVAKPELVLHATDPRIYSAGEETEFKPNHPSTTVVLNNTGNTEMRPVLVFTGPLARPAMTNLSIPLGFAGHPSIEVAYNEALEKAKEEALTKRLEEEAAARKAWFKELFEEEKITEEQYDEKIAAQTVAREKARKEEREAFDKEEAEGLYPTVKAGDQLLVDLGTPHLLEYYPGGLSANKPENASRYLTPFSVWWDLLPGNNSLQFSSFDDKDTGGTAVVQWASAYQL